MLPVDLELNQASMIPLTAHHLQLFLSLFYLSKINVGQISSELWLG